MKVYLALSNDYEDSFPVGIYNTLKEAKKAVENSKPVFTTSVLKYDTKTGKCLLKYDYYLYKTTPFWGKPV